MKEFAELFTNSSATFHCKIKKNELLVYYSINTEIEFNNNLHKLYNWQIHINSCYFVI